MEPPDWVDGTGLQPIDRYLATLWEHRGSDLLLVAGAPPMVRIDGDLRPIGGEEPFDAEMLDCILSSMLGPELFGRLAADRELDFSFGWQWQARFRGTAFFQRGSPGLALRLIPRDIPTFETLGIPPGIANLANTAQGLVLVTGPTGSGKSTTLASMIKHIESARAAHIRVSPCGRAGVAHTRYRPPAREPESQIPPMTRRRRSQLGTTVGRWLTACGRNRDRPRRLDRSGEWRS